MISVSGGQVRYTMPARATLVALAVLALLTLLATGLRLHRLDAQSLWYDEGFSVYLARMGLSEITERTAVDIQPPLYYYLLHAWIWLFGDGEQAVRGLSLLFGVLCLPVTYGLAWQLFRSRLAGLLAALFLAISPLHIWYGQEVRMYTLLTLWTLLSSYLLLVLARRAASEPQRLGLAIETEEVALWLGFTLLSVAALYTHYFAAFVLAFQALYLLLVLLPRGFRPLWLPLGGIASGVAIVAAYVPWLPNLVTRYGADASYWPGQLKLGEALVDVALLFVGGESISEEMGLLLGMGLGLAVGLALLALLASRFGQSIRWLRSVRAGAPEAESRYAPAPLLFLGLYLLLPPALILALAYNTPKFNARYTLIAHPALLLLLAGGLALLWQRRTTCLGNLVRWPFAALGLALILGVSGYASYQIYANPDFSRADFRGVARYLERHVGPEETVILVSGHIYPIFDYYAPEIERHLLPDSPTLDTTRTLDYSVAADLNRWLAGRGGVWLVLWQDEVVDPVGYLTTLLGDVGEELPVDRIFSQMGLRHYRLPAGARFSEQPAVDHPAEFNLGGRLRLLGYSQTGDWEVTLFWEAMQTLEEDYLVSLVLRDTSGQGWSRWDGRPSAYLYPTTRWRAGQIVPGRYELLPVPGTPPGDYGLEVGVYTDADPVGLDLLDAAGAAQGKRAVLGAVRLSVTAVTADQVETSHPLEHDLGGGLVLAGWDLDRFEAQPGDRLRLIPVWLVADPPRGNYAAEVLVTDAAGQVWPAGTFPPTNTWHPTGTWLPGQAWRGQITFRLPIQATPGEARLGLRLLDGDDSPLGSPADLTAITVLTTTRDFSPPQPAVARPADFDRRLALHGADLVPTPVTPGGVLRVTLYWQALADMDIPYTVFVHLLGLDGQVVAGSDAYPAGGTRPTTSWVPGEYVADAHQIPIPADLEPGAYIVEVGIYDAGARDFPRLQILGKEGQPETDRVIFTVSVQP